MSTKKDKAATAVAEKEVKVEVDKDEWRILRLHEYLDQVAGWPNPAEMIHVKHFGLFFLRLPHLEPTNPLYKAGL